MNIDDVVILYRVEYIDTGIGPFQSFPPDDCCQAGKVFAKWRMTYITPETHPIPYEDAIILPDMLERFACPSIQMIYFWFGPIIPYLQKLGLRLIEVTVRADGVRWGKGKTQVVYSVDSVIDTQPVIL